VAEIKESPIHYERGGESGLPSWNYLAFAACGAELCNDKGYDIARHTRNPFAVTCESCRAIVDCE
jgi:hypothetical protein